jgi:hypothetical protein
MTLSCRFPNLMGKVVFTRPDVKRLALIRPWRGSLLASLVSRWFKGPNRKKRSQWWKKPNNYRVYARCCRRPPVRSPMDDVEPTPGVYHPRCFKGCYWSSQKGCYMHRHVFYRRQESLTWRSQERDLCIQRCLTSWIFRHRYRRAKAATKIARWWRPMVDRLIFRAARRHWYSYSQHTAPVATPQTPK